MIYDSVFGEPIPSERAHYGELLLDPESIYLFTDRGDDRTSLPSEFVANNSDTTFRRLVRIGGDEVRLEEFDGRVMQTVFTRNRRQVEDLVGEFQRTYIDITGMSMAAWAPMVAACYHRSTDLTILYQEPEYYTKLTDPSPGWLFDLSLSFCEPRSLPGFFTAQANEVGEDGQILVVLVGFEGQRLGNMVEHQLSSAGRLLPLVGAPGYRPDYIFFAFDASREVFENNGVTESSVIYARANCPFETFYALQLIRERQSSGRLQIAPLGTKPAALGAILFTLAMGTGVDLFYDYPVRKLGGTTGRGGLNLYEVSQFWSSEYFELVRGSLSRD